MGRESRWEEEMGMGVCVLIFVVVVGMGYGVETCREVCLGFGCWVVLIA